MKQDIDIDLYQNHGTKIDILFDTGKDTSFMNREQAKLLKLRNIKGPKPLSVTYANGQTSISMNLSKYHFVSVIPNSSFKPLWSMTFPRPLSWVTHGCDKIKAIIDYGKRTIRITRPNGQKSTINFSIAKDPSMHQFNRSARPRS